MEVIFEHIQSKPEFYAWSFAIVNLLWGVFLYFNNKTHKEKIERIKQSLNLDLERRKKVFEMKATHYEAYFNNIDAFQAKHQNDYQEVFVPIINEFNRRYLYAEDQNDTAESTNATLWFSEQINQRTLDGFKEQQALEQQTNSLKLSASDEVAQLLEELRELYSEIFEQSSLLLSKLVEITVNKDQSAASEIQESIAILGENIKTKTKDLREEMRKDLQAI
jgi:small-conductance mechanosensitive channel